MRSRRGGRVGYAFRRSVGLIAYCSTLRLRLGLALPLFFELLRDLKPVSDEREENRKTKSNKISNRSEDTLVNDSLRGSVLGSPCKTSSLFVVSCVVASIRRSRVVWGITPSPARAQCRTNYDDTWLILPVVICLSQSLSHASVSSRHALERAKPRMAQEPDLILGTVILLGGDG